MSAPNQNRIKIGAREPWDKAHTYGRFHNDALSLACKNLTGSGFQLWCYINANADGWEFELSQKACENWGIPSSSYKRAKKELLEQGYLVQSPESKSLYIFYEIPLDQNGPKEEKTKMVLSKDQNGLEKDQNGPILDQNDMRNILINNKQTDKQETIETLSSSVFSSINRENYTRDGNIITIKHTGKKYIVPDGY